MQSKYTSLLKSSELLRHKRNVTSYRIQQQKEKQIEVVENTASDISILPC